MAQFTNLNDPGEEILLGEAVRISPNAAVGEILDVSESQVCSICHGDVGSMVKVEQVRPLKMGGCVDCHRDYKAPTDCTTCHF